MQPEIVTDDVGEHRRHRGGERTASSCCPTTRRRRSKAAFDEADLANLKFFANIPPGIEDMEGKVLERIQAAASN